MAEERAAMIIYYAMGGGLGHLVRARAVAHTLRLEGETTLLTSSAYATDARVIGPLKVQTVPPGLDRVPTAWRHWLEQTLAELRPRTMFVDTFPGGILGELAKMKFPTGIELHHVARLLRADTLPILFKVPAPLFETCFVVEELTAEHGAVLESRARAVQNLPLVDPPASGAPLDVAAIVSRHAPFWLVVHSGPPHEVDELVRYAGAKRAMEQAAVDLVVLTGAPIDDAPPRTFRYDLHPAVPLFPQALRIFGAGGFNLVRQTAPWRPITDLLPFERRYDDQYLRVARARRSVAAPNAT
ncbi:MAG: hypothetical protein EXS37_14055 [Opitutus sp.]|nr:hypothetical protein [Opitutus sp.]